VVELSKSGDLGYVRGSYDASYTAAGTHVREHGKYLTVWKKQLDGTWKVAVDMYNPDAPVIVPQEGAAGGIPGGVPGGVVGGIPGGVRLDTPGVLGNAPPPPPPPPREDAPPRRVRVGQGVMEAMLISRVQPVYPPLAQQARISGSVVLAIVVGRDGSVEDLKVLSGHPMLIQAAVDAVKQWRYKPYLLNYEPVEIQSTVTVQFSMQ
jgi:periplasmic protein TonB